MATPRRGKVSTTTGPSRVIRSQTQVQSRVNGLLINVPTDARGVIGRFASQGGNELVFAPLSDKQKELEETALKIDTGDNANKTEDNLA